MMIIALNLYSNTDAKVSQLPNRSPLLSLKKIRSFEKNAETAEIYGLYRCIMYIKLDRRESDSALVVDR